MKSSLPLLKQRTRVQYPAVLKNVNESQRERRLEFTTRDAVMTHRTTGQASKAFRIAQALIVRNQECGMCPVPAPVQPRGAAPALTTLRALILESALKSSWG
jgi:hypothetical protein